MISMKTLAYSSQIEVTLLRRIVRLSRQWIKEPYPSISDDDKTRDLTLQLFKSARRLKMTSFGTQIGKTYRLDVVHIICTVVVQTDSTNSNRKIMSYFPDESSTRALSFSVVDILQREGELLKLICLKCTRRGKLLQRRSPLNDDSFHVLRLTSDMRRLDINIMPRITNLTTPKQAMLM